MNNAFNYITISVLGGVQPQKTQKNPNPKWESQLVLGFLGFFGFFGFLGILHKKSGSMYIKGLPATPAHSTILVFNLFSNNLNC